MAKYRMKHLPTDTKNRSTVFEEYSQQYQEQPLEFLKSIYGGMELDAMAAVESMQFVKTMYDPLFLEKQGKHAEALSQYDLVPQDEDADVRSIRLKMLNCHLNLGRPATILNIIEKEGTVNNTALNTLGVRAALRIGNFSKMETYLKGADHSCRSRST
jgi:hypothetical protein